MPPNFFDQFDSPSPAPAQTTTTPQQSQANYFDQFDEAASPAGAPAKKPFGLMDTWPVRLAKSLGEAAYSAVTLPGDVYAGRAQVPQSANMPGGEDTSNIGRVFNLAALANPAPPRAAPSLGPPVGTVAPTQEALDLAINTGFKEAKKSGAEINPQGLARVSQDAQTTILGEHGIDANLAPRTYNTLAQLERPPAGGTVTFQNLHSLRQNLGNIATDAVRSGAGSEARAARTAQQSLDTYLSNIPQSDIVAGDPAKAAQILSDAIGNAAAKFRSERIQNIADTARANVEASSSMGQLGRNIKQGTKQFLKSDARGFSPEEIAQAEAVRRSGRLPGIIGSMSGGSGGIGSLVSGILTGGVGPAVGAGFKQLESALTQRQLAKLDELVRMRSPLAQQQQMLATPAPYAPNALLQLLARQSAPYFPGAIESSNP